MFDTTFKFGAPSRTFAVTGSPASKAPSRSAMRRANSSAGSGSPGLASTSKYCRRRSITSGKMGRATSTFFIDFLLKEQPSGKQEQGQQNDRRPAEIRKESRHDNAARFGNCLDHEVGRVADIAGRAHEHGTGRDGSERGGAGGHQGWCIAAGEVEEHEISWRVVEERRQQ